MWITFDVIMKVEVIQIIWVLHVDLRYKDSFSHEKCKTERLFFRDSGSPYRNTKQRLGFYLITIESALNDKLWIGGSVGTQCAGLSAALKEKLGGHGQI